MRPRGAEEHPAVDEVVQAQAVLPDLVAGAGVLRRIGRELVIAVPVGHLGIDLQAARQFVVDPQAVEGLEVPGAGLQGGRLDAARDPAGHELWSGRWAAT